MTEVLKSFQVDASNSVNLRSCLSRLAWDDQSKSKIARSKRLLRASRLLCGMAAKVSLGAARGFVSAAISTAGTRITVRAGRRQQLLLLGGVNPLAPESALTLSAYVRTIFSLATTRCAKGRRNSDALSSIFMRYGMVSATFARYSKTVSRLNVKHWPDLRVSHIARLSGACDVFGRALRTVRHCRLVGLLRAELSEWNGQPRCESTTFDIPA
ncbi:hypothetical protein DFH08DRAFT_810699 [Mycena albidolilacea]|uniref:Uncharacterized protein n=1 Tax=Mycena albidolilacea TaxID=1033008 RepID=A0AAD6ZY04_9AGAR|nr:hypothetical protein DFH08DRAFT_810699 [Mycena albidolilacea]